MFKTPQLIAGFLLLFSHYVLSDEFQFVDSTFCPFICDPNVAGKEGFVIDILRDALATKGHTINFIIVPYKRALSMVRSGEAHALPDIYKEDAPDLIIGKSIIRVGNNQFFVRDDSNWAYTAKDSWRDISIGVVDGYTFAHQRFDAYLAEQKRLQRSKVVFISGENTYQRLLELLITKKIDAIVDDNAFIQYELHRFSTENNLVNLPPVISAGILSKKGQHVVAFSPKHIEIAELLMEIIDPFVMDLYKTGKIEKYLSPYGID